MIKKLSIITFLSVGALYFAQDASVIKNTAEIYSSSNYGGTAKFNSMAGSMGALGGDLSVIAVNPAATGVFITSDISGTLSVQNNKNESTLFGKSFQSDYSKTNLGQIGAVISFDTDRNSPWKFVNLAFNYNSKNIDDYVQTPAANTIQESVTYTDSSNNSVTDNLLYNGHAYDRLGTASNMSIALGGNYDNKFYLGGAVNIKNADIQQADFFQLKMQNLGETAYYNKQYTPYNEVSNGISASVGVIGKVNNNFRIGAAIETPTIWNIERSYTEYGLNSSNIWVSEVFDESRRLTTPMKATLSGALVANKNFALNVDYTLGLTKPKYKVEGDAETQLNNYFSSSAYENVSELKVGGEYRMNAFRLRGGYGIEKNPFSAQSLQSFNSSGGSVNTTLNNPFLGKRETLAGGIGYDFKSFYIDAGVQNVKSTYDNPFFGGKYAVTANNAFSVTDGDGVDNATSIVSEVKNTKTNFFLTLGWKF
jgi:hypothetical protein